MVTMISQDLSEFALHARAILGLPVPRIRCHGPAASAVILVEGNSSTVGFDGLGAALAEPDVQIRLFGKPEVRGRRRMGVALALGEDVEQARRRARCAAAAGAGRGRLTPGGLGHGDAGPLQFPALAVIVRDQPDTRLDGRVRFTFAQPALLLLSLRLPA